MDQLHTVHARHADVGDDGVQAVARENIQGLFSVGGFRNGASEILSGIASGTGGEITANRLQTDGDFAGALEPAEQCGGCGATIAGKVGGTAGEKCWQRRGDFRYGQRKRDTGENPRQSGTAILYDKSGGARNWAGLSISRGNRGGAWREPESRSGL